MAFIDKLPEYHKMLLNKTVQLESTIQNLWGKLDDEEDSIAKEHGDCFCEYCPYSDYVPRPLLTLKEREVIENEIAKLEEEKHEAVTYTNRLEKYATLWGVSL